MFMKVTEFFNELRQKKVGVIGLGVSHTDLVKLLLKKGISVTVLDKNENIGEEYNELSSLGARFITGEKYLDNLTDFDVVFRTPGMYFLSEKLQTAIKNGVVITGEMEVFLALCPCKLYGITGSDGKTTSTAVIGEMFKASGKTVYVGGNIGKALLPMIEEMSENDICVVELSSFQLISMRESPNVALITNIAPNHLDVHKDMQEYIDAKKNLILHQNAFSRTVLNMDNELTYSLSELVRGELCYFSTKQKPYNGAYLDEEGYLCCVNNNVEKRVLHKDEIKLPGMHNVENYLGVFAVVNDSVPKKIMAEVAKNFGGVEHRMEFVRELSGVRYYNDSIASSPTRTIAGLKAFNKKIIIIAGGYDKKIPYEPLAPIICERVKTLILLGATAKKIETAVKACDSYVNSGLQIINVKTLEEAVKTANKIAESGDIVSLSPASASFDLYKNFEERGKHFKRLIMDLE